MIILRVRLEKSKNNFVFKASNIWNKLQQYVFSRSESDSNGVIVPGFSTHSIENTHEGPPLRASKYSI